MREGDAISPFYDPMIAKLIVWGKDRQAAHHALTQALTHYQIAGLATNLSFLKRLVDSAPFTQAELDTGLIERHHDALFPLPQPASIQTLALATAALLQAEKTPPSQSAANDPWSLTNGWRMNLDLERLIQFKDELQTYPLTLCYQPTGYRLVHNDLGYTLKIQKKPAGDPCSSHEFRLQLGEQIMSGEVVCIEDNFHIFNHDQHSVLHYLNPQIAQKNHEAEGGRLTAPMPGKIVAIMVAIGETVTKGAPLMTMEAMKMEHTLTAPAAGTVDAILYALGDQVEEGKALLRLSAIENHL